MTPYRLGGWAEAAGHLLSLKTGRWDNCVGYFYITMTKVSDSNNQLEMKSSKHDPVRNILNQNPNICHYTQLPVGEKCVLKSFLVMI